LEYEPVDGTAILLEQTATGDAQVTNCRLTNGEVVRLRVLVQEDCHPTAVTTLAGGEGIVFAGTPPGTTVYGLYWRRWAAPSSYTDSLLVGLGPGFVPPNCMDALSDGTGLVFGLQDGLGFNATTRYLEHELMAGGTSELLLARPGQPISVRSNPVAPQQVALSHYAAASGDLGSSGTAILLLDRGNHTTTELNTRTSLNACLSPLYGTADWSPRATELLLPSGAVDHAGSPFPTPLWVLVGVSQ
jgi:hypothetical protein